jgi:hypothetical protein
MFSKEMVKLWLPEDKAHILEENMVRIVFGFSCLTLI